jgi:hypothetical protein
MSVSDPTGKYLSQAYGQKKPKIVTAPELIFGNNKIQPKMS